MTHLQHPIGSPFSAASTAAEVAKGIDLTGKTAIVTGGHSGIGLETVRALAGAGAQVIVPARDPQRSAEALSGIANVEIDQLDLSDAASIAGLGARVVASGRTIDALINGAGIMAAPLSRDADGHESQFATNHLGHFRLTAALWPALLRSGDARVISVSSRGHQIAGVDFDDIDFIIRPYDKWVAYGQSKTANALFALGLDAGGKAVGVRAFSLHPGQVLTGLARHLSEEEIAGFDARDEHGNVRVDPARGMKTVPQAAATSVWAATSAQLAGMGGVYLEDCDIAAINTAEAGRKGVAPWAADYALAERLWQVSEAMTGVSIG
ncbi:NADP-dependent 3-hydroxy acid dehydrogenase YdfG [Devosia sp. YR412]|uniref:oxidoreductase n=1 Tax=Devosia sp. YR412 TaxID=1881030 RepID=UPI0008B2AAB6|nr:oxidoreductase [Devosia sp. YR412]SEP81790.1 NADP-dependent 3-hydroxy acid dehydrogenase YdfG [Devosia sp. YR412]